MPAYITREQDYALRIAAYLAGLEKSKQTSIKKLSNDLFISKKFASRIVHKLKLANIIETTQGVYGGVCLKKDASKLSLYEVLVSVGYKVKFNQCLAESFNCQLMMKCKFHIYFEELEKNIIKSFKQKFINEFTIESVEF